MNKTSIIVGRLLGVSLATYSVASHAYLDPGTASIILQGTIAAIAGAAITLKLYWYRIKSMFTKSSEKDVENTDFESEEDPNGG